MKNCKYVLLLSVLLLSACGSNHVQKRTEFPIHAVSAEVTDVKFSEDKNVLQFKITPKDATFYQVFWLDSDGLIVKQTAWSPLYNQVQYVQLVRPSAEATDFKLNLR